MLLWRLRNTEWCLLMIKVCLSHCSSPLVASFSAFVTKIAIKSVFLGRTLARWNESAHSERAKGYVPAFFWVTASGWQKVVALAQKHQHQKTTFNSRAVSQQISFCFKMRAAYSLRASVVNIKGLRPEPWWTPGAALPPSHCSGFLVQILRVGKKMPSKSHDNHRQEYFPLH